MSNEFNMVAVVENKGVITSNFMELKNMLQKKMEEYSSMVYVGDDALSEMKADRATLNKLVSEIDKKRKEIKKEFLKPCDEFETNMKELTEIVKNTISSLDTEIKNGEEKLRMERKKKIMEFYQQYSAEKGFLNDPFCQVMRDKIYDPKWENKSVTQKTWKTSIMSQIDDYMRNIEMLKNMNEPDWYERAVEKYQAQLEIRDALEYIDDKRRIRAEEEAARIRAEAEAEAARIRAEAEAKARAEAEIARAKEEAERKAAEEIARVKAEAEQARVREEAKAKAEAEAKVAEALENARRNNQQPQNMGTPEPYSVATGFFGNQSQVRPDRCQAMPAYEYPAYNPQTTAAPEQPAVKGYTSPEYVDQMQFHFNENNYDHRNETCEVKIYTKDKEWVREILSLNKIWFEM